MNIMTDRDIDTLAGEVKELRSQFARLGDRVNTLGHTAGAAGVRATRAGKRVLTTANDGAHYIVHEVEENPMLWAAAALGIFSFVIAIFSGTRRG